MNANGFREDELVTRKVKVNGQWEARTFPVVGGRLRLAHEQNDNLSLQTKLVSWDGQYAVFECCATTGKGQFVGYGTANGQRDTKLADSLVELAETRSIARALRFAGFGLEFTGAEEVSHVAATEAEQEQTTDKGGRSVFPEDKGNNKPETKSAGNGNGKATGAQVRALFALSRRANYDDNDIAQMLTGFEVSRFEDLSREAASRLITSLQVPAAA